jgi:hypothetical protein
VIVLGAVSDGAKKVMFVTALKSTKWRFSSLNHQNFEFFGLVPKSPSQTGLICVKILEPNISSFGPLTLSFSSEGSPP